MTPDFDSFWNLYPRKVAKKDAREAWSKLTPEKQFAAFHSLPVHVRYWEAAGTSAEFLPYPATWLRGERWEDELQLPDAETATDPSWHKTTIGIERKAREVGITARPGEDWYTLKARVLAKIKEAA